MLIPSRTDDSIAEMRKPFDNPTAVLVFLRPCFEESLQSREYLIAPTKKNDADPAAMVAQRTCVIQ